MRERDAFIDFINAFKTVSPTISDEQRKGLLRRAVQEHGLSVDEASEILTASGLVVGEKENYFKVLGFSIEDFQDLNESSIASHVDAAHKKLYRESLNAGGRVRPDGKSEEQWRTLLNHARDTLIDAEKRRTHIAVLQDDVSPLAESFSEEEFSAPEPTPLLPTEQDGMVLIPTGNFQMGSNDTDAYNEEQPVHTVYVDSFYMDQYPVTNAQYKEFLDVNPAWRKSPKWYELGNKHNTTIPNKYHDGDYLKHWTYSIYPDEYADHPVVWVSWYAAMAYAQWIGKRLPTEAEWEKAARGGLTGLKYPWGDSIDLSNANYDLDVSKTTSVGTYPANGFGLYDMVGNVREWCLDRWEKGFYVSSPHNNPVSDGSINEIIDSFTSIKTSRVLRGGSWVSTPQNARVAYRSGTPPFFTCMNIGFRCVRSV